MIKRIMERLYDVDDSLGNGPAPLSLMPCTAWVDAYRQGFVGLEFERIPASDRLGKPFTFETGSEAGTVQTRKAIIHLTIGGVPIDNMHIALRVNKAGAKTYAILWPRFKRSGAKEAPSYPIFKIEGCADDVVGDWNEFQREVIKAYREFRADLLKSGDQHASNKATVMQTFGADDDA